MLLPVTSNFDMCTTRSQSSRVKVAALNRDLVFSISVIFDFKCSFLTQNREMLNNEDLVGATAVLYTLKNFQSYCDFRSYCLQQFSEQNNQTFALSLYNWLVTFLLTRFTYISHGISIKLSCKLCFSAKYCFIN